MLLLLFATSLFYFADAEFIMAEGGNCLTYDNTLSGTSVKFAACEFDNLRHKSWEMISTASSGPSMICIVGTAICLQVGSDRKVRLAKKDDTDSAQLWTKSSGGKFANELIGPNMCLQAMFKDEDHKHKTQDYLQMKQCSDDYNQKFATFSTVARLAEYFRDSFYERKMSHNSEVEGYPASYGHPPVYPYLNIHPKLVYPYYYV